MLHISVQKKALQKYLSLKLLTYFNFNSEQAPSIKKHTLVVEAYVETSSPVFRSLQNRQGIAVLVVLCDGW